MDLPEGRKLYFASDFHLGLPDLTNSIQRERLLCHWLDEVRPQMEHLFLVGDIFDVWFEYRKVVPKGHTRLLGKLSELSDSGIKIDFFSGNHDIWMRDYFEKEIGVNVHHQPIEFSANGKRFIVGHGDGLGPGDKGYKILKTILRSPFLQWLYRRIHPDTGITIADYFSKRGGKKDFQNIAPFKGDDKEWLVQYCKERLQKEHIDYFVFGHRHLPLMHPVGPKSLYINLGDWLNYNSYAVFDGNEMNLFYYNKNQQNG